LLAVALVTGQLAGSLRRTQSEAEALAADERAMYELATAALRSPEVTVALGLLAKRAVRLEGVSRFALMAMDSGHAVALAGGELTADELRQAAWAFDNGRSVGAAISNGSVRIMRTRPQAALQPDQRELLLDLDGQANRLDRLVGDMLDLSRLEAGVELDREPHRFADLVGSALHQLRPDLKSREVTVDVADDLPPVEVDELQVGRVLANLLENA